MDKETFTDIAEYYMSLVYRVELNMLKKPADADDATQNTMLRVCRSNSDFEDEEHLNYWLI